MKKICWPLLFLFFCGCYTISRTFITPDTIKKIEVSEKIKKARKAEAEKYTLAEKAVILEQHLANFSFPPFLPEYQTEEKPGLPHAEHALFYLSALTSKYAATNETNVQIVAKQIIKAIISMDKSNGLDGFLPLETIVNDEGNLEAVNENTHANVYVQLLFAYVDAYLTFTDKEIQTMISDHVALVAQHFLKHNYQLCNQYGQKMNHGDLSIKKIQFLAQPSAGFNSFNRRGVKID